MTGDSPPRSTEEERGRDLPGQRIPSLESSEGEEISSPARRWQKRGSWTGHH